MKTHQPGELYQKFQKKMKKSEFSPVKSVTSIMSKKKSVKLVPPSKGHTPKGAHGRAAVRALGRTKTTGNFARIEKARGKSAAIAAYQNALAAHKGKKKVMKKEHSAAAIKGIKKFVAEEAKEKKHKKMMCKTHKKVMCKRCG